MNCAYCGASDTRVINSRPSAAGDSIRRRRECQACSRRFTTIEYVEKVEMMVTKRDGSREPFQLKKVRDGIEKSCEKRPVSVEQIDEVVANVERDLLARNEKEIQAQEIGRIILKRLKEIDPVAYLRFASVYKQFQDLHDFNAEIKELLKE